MKLNVRFVDFWSHFDSDGFLPMIALREVCKARCVQLCEVDRNAPYSTTDNVVDIVFFSIFGQSHWKVPPSAIKIFYTGENICPDFNACDYAFAFEHLDFGNRYMRMPNYLSTKHFRDIMVQMEQIDRSAFKPDMAKRKFCAFVVSNSNANSVRHDFFEALSVYKRVDSGGRYLNNVGSAVKDKIEFCAQHKFTIAFENTRHVGYTTEKIVDAFAAGSVPIYWGDPEVCRVFNPKSFIDVTHCKTVDEMVRKVQAIDTDDDAYMQMLRENPFVDSQFMYREQYLFVISFVANMLDNIQNSAGWHYNREFWGERYINDRKMAFANANESLIKKFFDKLSKLI